MTEAFNQRTAGILSTKLVARESNDLKVVGIFLLQVLVKLLETAELRCETAFRGGVYHEDDFVVEVG